MEKVKQFFSFALHKLLSEEKNPERPEFYGYTISPEYWNFWVWPVVSISAGFIVALAAFPFLWIVMSFSEALYWSLGFWFLATIVVGFPDGKETVPPATSAMITFMGNRKRYYRLEGVYLWTGKIFLLDRSRIKKDEGTDEDGFILMEPFQIKIWNNSTEKGKTRIVAQAKNNASVSSTLTLSCQHYDPMKWINNEDPVLALADRSREGFRGAIRQFTDSDCASLKNRLGYLMEGGSLIAIALPANYDKARVHSIITDRSGQLLIEKLKPVNGRPEDDLKKKDNETDEQFKARLKIVVKECKEEYVKTVEDRAAKEQREACYREGSTTLDIRDIEEYSVEKALSSLADALGTKITDAAVGDLQLSESVQKTANEASSEVEQREAQLKSAEAIKDSAKKLGKARRKHGELALAIAAGADNNPNVKVAVVGGETDSLSRAAATHATLNNKGEKES